MNLVTTLTTQTAYDRHSSHSIDELSKPDSSITRFYHPDSITLAPTLAKIIAMSPTNDIILQFTPIVEYTAVATPHTPSAAPKSTLPDSSSLAVLDRFMSSWSKLVGDPVVSKWIVIALGISVFLNGYLLKGIASGSDNAFAPGSAAEAAARILLASTGSLLDHNEAGKKDGGTTEEKMKRWKEGSGLKISRTNGVGEGDLQADWTNDDAAAMTRRHARGLKSAEEEASKEVPEIIQVLSNSSAHARTTSHVVAASSSTNEGPMGEGNDEDDIEDEGSPILIRTKKRNSTITSSTPLFPTSMISPASTAAATPTVSTLGLIGVPSLTVSSSTSPPIKSIKLSPSTINLLPSDRSIPDVPRTLEVCKKIFEGGVGAVLLNDEEIIMLVQNGVLAAYALEKVLGDLERSVAVRRALICTSTMIIILLACRLIADLTTK